MMNALLVGLDSRTRPLELHLARLPVILGRGPDADIRLDDHWISRRHCLLEEHDGALVVRDLGSKNGTLVNNQTIHEAKLLPGDELSLGLCTFRAEYEPSASDSAPSAGSPVGATNS